MNDENFLKHVQSQILKFQPIELIPYKMEQALSFQILFYYKKTFTQLLKVLFACILRDQYEISSKKGKEEILFFFGSDYIDRNDHKKKFENVVSLCDSYCVIEPKRSLKIRWRHLFRIGKILKWSWHFRDCDLDRNLRQYLIYCMFEQYCRLQNIIKYSNNMPHLKSFVCWCDVMSSDYIATQYFKGKGIHTATLEHGFYNTNQLDGRLAIVNSPADDFLCWNKSIIRSAQKITGIESKWKLVGSPEFINRPVIQEMKRNNNGQFGVALSAFTKADENKYLLKTAYMLVKQFHLNCVLRPHPSLRKEDYQHFLNDKRITWKNDETFTSFLHKKDFVLVGESGIYFDIIYNMIPFFHYVKDDTMDIFAAADWNRFHSQQQLLTLFSKFQNDDTWMEAGLREAKQQLLTEEPPDFLYQEYFNNILKKQ